MPKETQVWDKEKGELVPLSEIGDPPTPESGAKGGEAIATRTKTRKQADTAEEPDDPEEEYAERLAVLEERERAVKTREDALDRLTDPDRTPPGTASVETDVEALYGGLTTGAEAEHVAGQLVTMLLGVRYARYRPNASPDYRQDLTCLGCSMTFRPSDAEKPAELLFCTSCIRDAESNPEGTYEP
jgi:hypothetical protein